MKAVSAADFNRYNSFGNNLTYHCTTAFKKGSYDCNMIV